MINHGETVDALLKSKSSVKGHEYDVCSSGCQLYGINDDQESCVDCGKLRYKTDPNQSQAPAASMKLMSVRDMLSQMLTDLATRELLYYRANRESVAGQLTNIFDGDNYKQLVQQGLFSNPNDIAIGLYTNGFHNGVEHCRSKVYLLLTSDDIPAVADMAHIGSHTSLFGCRFCETKGKCPTNRRHGMYFDDISTQLRPLEDFKVGNPCFRPVQHYLVHIPYIIKQQGPLQCYSTCSMERVIGVFSKLIKSKSKGGRNASFLVKQFAIHNYTNMAISICDEINLIRPKPYGRESYMDLPNDPSSAQLWEPFHQFVNLNNDLVEGVGGPSVKEALLKYYRRTTGLTGHEFGDSVVVVAARLWMDLTSQSTCTLGYQTQPTYATISENDICHQVGLVQYPPNGNQFYIIVPYYIFNNNMRITKGNLFIL
ncbi:hypothetical protein PHYBLDRAFT_71583 [Phycomyces blakesleeanus NRRL 1555(-)]|uniref:Uncharacterized protein n=1 Tax=Phycomyces blakesleeanus (strain ATCC 8743b / DSM 1359 / FGSC 10004 / NBRC 33097 / NRRL 1555) TaxID=763407 RepID=A0A162X7Z6_PHYB8|nr:hypothetical protein PHYBLDRAFT_71583 [Phycomyces blakesleeanus NRRL 1555(-)]OAD73085.1 hypothetical protein PHYBLDRAFT_71583 [Phycomyces blakesleeanus NRRL 1555(-)]|eukprot:XP_018291125.1 hypothetical protein PHYBLDRAFT_71583 [Phycomyces blakesleeanus NRRL 1555(-)]